MKYYIVIPAHNEEKFIGLTLDSLLNQTVLPSKVVVVNDNSTDKTSEIVEGRSGHGNHKCSWRRFQTFSQKSIREI